MLSLPYQACSSEGKTDEHVMGTSEGGDASFGKTDKAS